MAYMYYKYFCRVSALKRRIATLAKMASRRPLFRANSKIAMPVAQQCNAFVLFSLTLNSEPLPGGVRSVKPPELLVPAHLRYLRFLAH